MFQQCSITSIVQGADWHYGPTKSINTTLYNSTGQPTYIKYSSLATAILAFIFLIFYLVFQVCLMIVLLKEAWSFEVCQG